jgi:hypothetical protein
MARKPVRHSPTVTTLQEVEDLIPPDLRRKVERHYRKTADAAGTEDFLMTEFLIHTGRDVTAEAVHDFVCCVTTHVHDEEANLVFTLVKGRDPKPKSPDDNIWD